MIQRMNSQKTFYPFFGFMNTVHSEICDVEAVKINI